MIIIKWELLHVTTSCLVHQPTQARPRRPRWYKYGSGFLNSVAVNVGTWRMTYITGCSVFDVSNSGCFLNPSEVRKAWGEYVNNAAGAQIAYKPVCVCRRCRDAHTGVRRQHSSRNKDETSTRCWRWSFGTFYKSIGQNVGHWTIGGQEYCRDQSYIYWGNCGDLSYLGFPCNLCLPFPHCLTEPVVIPHVFHRTFTAAVHFWGGRS